MDERIKKVLRKVFGNTAKVVYFNGFRAEGFSIIVAESVWSHRMEKLIKVYNEDIGDEKGRPLGEWRVRKAKLPYIVNKHVPKDVRNDCYEVRLIFKNWYKRYD